MGRLPSAGDHFFIYYHLPVQGVIDKTTNYTQAGTKFKFSCFSMKAKPISEKTHARKVQIALFGGALFSE